MEACIILRWDLLIYSTGSTYSLLRKR